MTREMTHMKAFTAALESLGKNPFSIGQIAPTPGLVDEYFNDSTGVGDEQETDSRGPWNEGGSWKIREITDLQQGVESRAGNGKRRASDDNVVMKVKTKKSA
jgi:Mn-containing catalase